MKGNNPFDSFQDEDDLAGKNVSLEKQNVDPMKILASLKVQKNNNGKEEKHESTYAEEISNSIFTKMNTKLE